MSDTSTPDSDDRSTERDEPSSWSATSATDEITAAEALVDRSAVIAAGLRVTAAWSLRFLLIGLAVAAALWVLGRIWVGVLPIMLALLFSSVLWPVVVWAERRRVPQGCRLQQQCWGCWG